MPDLAITAERILAAPAADVYRAIADYRNHHRPEGFLPPAFTFLDVLEGGVGAGTRIRFGVKLGWMRSSTDATISEPEPGRVLVETADAVTSTFTVDPVPGGTHVRIHSVFRLRGVLGTLAGRSMPDRLRPVYEEELTRLEAYAAGLAARGERAAA
jgi:uncharacterized protein YndB with AHSA1/START domain